jgi:hypothetical protein
MMMRRNSMDKMFIVRVDEGVDLDSQDIERALDKAWITEPNNDGVLISDNNRRNEVIRNCVIT